MKKKLLRRSKPTIKIKLIMFVGGFLLLFSILLYALFFWFQSILEEKVSDLAMQTMETLTGNVEIYIQNNVRLSNTIASDSSLKNLLKQSSSFSSSTSIWSMVELLEKLKDFSMINQYIYSISIYNPESNKILSTADGIYNVPHELDWATYMNDRSAPLIIGVDLAGVVPVFASNNLSMISVLRKIPGKDTNNILLVNSDKQLLDLFIGEIDLWEGTGMVISDVEGNIFYTKGNSLSHSVDSILLQTQRKGSTYETIEYLDQKYIAVNKHSEVTGWNMSLIIPYDEIMRDVMRMRQYAIFILVGIAVFVLLLFSILYLQIFNPIKKLIQSMMIVEKGLTFKPIEINRLDELGFLQQRFNEMIQNEQAMRRSLFEEKLNKKEMELKFLQSQVNPHFLYNTLDSIYWVAEQSGVDEISDVVLDLSKFFRLSLSKGRNFITIQETVEHLECYLRIQQFRHTDKFEVDWNIDQKLREVEIMKLMLQPVVENAIIHGLERAVGTCKVTIDIVKQGSYLECSVTDTGIGMNDESLKHLLEEIKQDEGDSNATYGLRNIYQRLHILYGENMRFQIWSKPKEGTKVTILIELSHLGGIEYEHESDHR